jgi:hypothetical protein
MKMTVFWDIVPCSLVETDRRFGVLTASIISVMSLIVLMMAAVSTSEKSVNFYKTARRSIPEDTHLQQTSYQYT